MPSTMLLLIICISSISLLNQTRAETSHFTESIILPLQWTPSLLSSTRPSLRTLPLPSTRNLTGNDNTPYRSVSSHSLPTRLLPSMRNRTGRGNILSPSVFSLKVRYVCVALPSHDSNFANDISLQYEDEPSRNILPSDSSEESEVACESMSLQMKSFMNF